MSDQTPGDWFGTPPPQHPPMPSPIAAPEPVNTIQFDPQLVEKRGGIGGRLAVVGLSLALIGGAGFAVKTALGDGGGSSSPESAADAMFDALENEDFVGVVEMMAPSEREAYIEPMLDIVQEFARLSGADVGDDIFNQLPVEIEMDGLAYEVTELGPGVSWLSVTDGQMQITYNGDDMPEWVDDVSGSMDTPSGSETSTVSLADADYEFALVEENGSWYWSSTYTMAESVRRDAGWALPAFNGTSRANGAGSPEVAVENAVRSLLSFDLRSAFTQLDPEEFGALYDYSEFFLDEAAVEFESLQDEFTSQGITYSLDELGLASSEIRGRTVVSVNGFQLSGSDGTDDFSLAYSDGCVLVEVSGAEEVNSCNEAELWQEFGGLSASDGLQNSFTEVKTGIRVVERDGEWYLSGGPTLFGFLADILSALDEADWNEFSDSFGEVDDLVSGFVDGSVVSAIDGDGQVLLGEDDVLDEEYLDESNEGFDESFGDAFEDYLKIEPDLILPGYDFWTDPPSNSTGLFMYDLDEPLTVTNLYADSSFIELDEFASPYDQQALADAMAASFACELQEAGRFGDGTVAYDCGGALVVTYGRWMILSFEATPETVALANAQLAHLRSFGE